MCARGFETVSDITGEKDYYRDIKKDWNTAALGLLHELEKIVKDDPEPLKKAVKISVIGNLIDFGVGTVIREKQEKAGGACTEGLREILNSYMEEGVFDFRDWNEFEYLAKNAKNIVFVADNAGEIVLDTLLIDQLGNDRVTCIVPSVAHYQ